jgi:hypothetical protein
MHRALWLALLLSWALASAAQPITQRFPSDLPGVDLVLTNDPAPLTADYAAETRSSLLETDPYLVARGLDQGLVRLVNEHSRQVRRYTVPRTRIRGIVRIKHDMSVLDRVDLVFTRSHLILVHTSSSTGGLFTGSDVYELPFIGDDDVDRRLLMRKPGLLKILDLGLAFHKSKP